MRTDEHDLLQGGVARSLERWELRAEREALGANTPEKLQGLTTGRFARACGGSGTCEETCGHTCSSTCSGQYTMSCGTTCVYTCDATAAGDLLR